jgi:diketogulonate reductase-like aldo/keto reductase
MRTIQFHDGAQVPLIGQGTWKMGEGERPRSVEVTALRAGIELGLTLIDTAEMYGEGTSEEVVGEAIRGLRERVFLVTKVYPHHANRREMRAACERSLRRLGTGMIDLYLLHWRSGDTPLEETADAFESLRQDGKIRRWGVSNFDVDDLAELRRPECAANQVLYNPRHRGIEHDLLPWCVRHSLPVMAYSPVGQGGRLLQQAALKEIAGRHQASPAQVALAWALRQPGVLVIPKAGDVAHVRENAAALDLRLEPEDLAAIDRTFPPPSGKRPLAML